MAMHKRKKIPDGRVKTNRENQETMEQLDAIIAEQMKNLPSWWKHSGDVSAKSSIKDALLRKPKWKPMRKSGRKNL